GGAGGVGRVRAFDPEDAPGTVRLLMDAYRGAASAECFAPRGRIEEWAWYTRQLLRTPACGVLLPAVCFAADLPGIGLAGVALTTTIAPGVAHLAQLAVAPAAQGRGVGRQLLDAVLDQLQVLGYERVTLMVSEDNAPARSLYAAAGFTAGPRFLFASRAMPARLARAS
ncbi:MAG: N-acetyltransferase, partial [Acidobacteriota bacterium]